MTSLLTRIHALAQRTGWPDFISNKFNLIQIKWLPVQQRKRRCVLKRALWAPCNTAPLNKNKKLRAISVLLGQQNKKQNAAGISTGEDRGEQHTGADKTIKLTSVPLCGELTNTLNSPLESQLFLMCDGFMLLHCS